MSLRRWCHPQEHGRKGLLVKCENGISSYELGRALGVTQKTAWFMGLLDRHGKDGVSRVRPEVLSILKRGRIQSQGRNHVQPGSTVHTDSLASYLVSAASPG